MRLPSSLATLLLIGPLAAAPLAQDSNTDRPDPKPERLIAPEPLQDHSPTVAVTRATALVGRPLSDGEGNLLGTVHDLVLDQTGRVLAALVSRVQDTDDSLTLVGLPTELLSLSADDELFVAARAEEPMGEAPTLPNAAAVSAVWVVATYEHFGLAPPSLIQTNGEAAAHERGEDTMGEEQADTAGLWLVRQVIGQPAYGSTDQALGTIEDVALDLAHQRLVFVALRATTADGNGLHAVPFVIPLAKPRDGTVTLDLDAAELILLPTLEGERWTWPVEA